MTEPKLSKVADAVGLKDPEMNAIWQQVKANSARLNACQAHAFEPSPDQEHKKLGKRYICTRCQGEVDAHAYYWHEIGRKSAVMD